MPKFGYTRQTVQPSGTGKYGIQPIGARVDMSGAAAIGKSLQMAGETAAQIGDNLKEQTALNDVMEKSTQYQEEANAIYDDWAINGDPKDPKKAMTDLDTKLRKKKSEYLVQAGSSRERKYLDQSLFKVNTGLRTAGAKKATGKFYDHSAQVLGGALELEKKKALTSHNPDDWMRQYYKSLSLIDAQEKAGTWLDANKAAEMRANLQSDMFGAIMRNELLGDNWEAVSDAWENDTPVFEATVKDPETGKEKTVSKTWKDLVGAKGIVTMENLQKRVAEANIRKEVAAEDKRQRESEKAVKRNQAATYGRYLSIMQDTAKTSGEKLSMMPQLTMDLEAGRLDPDDYKDLSKMARGETGNRDDRQTVDRIMEAGRDYQGVTDEEYRQMVRDAFVNDQITFSTRKTFDKRPDIFTDPTTQRAEDQLNDLFNTTGMDAEDKGTTKRRQIEAKYDFRERVIAGENPRDIVDEYVKREAIQADLPSGFYLDTTIQNLEAYKRDITQQFTDGKRSQDWTDRNIRRANNVIRLIGELNKMKSMRGN